ncbi:MAG: DUF4351 domain-containing protein [Methanobacteriota archaeon]
MSKENRWLSITRQIFLSDQATRMLEAREEGREKGIEEGEIRIIKRLLSRKFGSLPPEILQGLEKMDESTLEALSVELLDMKCLDDLQKFIVSL